MDLDFPYINFAYFAILTLTPLYFDTSHGHRILRSVAAFHHLTQITILIQISIPTPIITSFYPALFPHSLLLLTVPFLNQQACPAFGSAPNIQIPQRVFCSHRFLQSVPSLYIGNIGPVRCCFSLGCSEEFGYYFH